tara:strand:- start:132746 stop:132883 length:138 start_codon:yes stop_codon:yes gene_type:complete
MVLFNRIGSFPPFAAFSMNGSFGGTPNMRGQFLSDHAADIFQNQG